MNLANAMRKGLELYPNAVQIFDSTLVQIEDNKIIGFCALGAALIAVVDESSLLSLYNPNENKLYDLLSKHFDELENSYLKRRIWTLNDVEKVAISKIANAVELMTEDYDNE